MKCTRKSEGIKSKSSYHYRQWSIPRNSKHLRQRIFTFKNIDEHGDIYHDIGKFNPWGGVLFSFGDKKIADIAISSRLKCKLKQRAKTLRRKSYESR